MKILLLLVSMMLTALSVDAQAQHRCFGAGGDQCGALSGQGFRLSACVATPFAPGFSFCNVSGGSWAHDECCFRNPRGNFCDGAGTAGASICRVEMVRAIHRAGFGYQWTRLVDNRRSDDDGLVNRAEYCARPGAGVHRDDVGFCCNTRPAARRVHFPFNIGRPDLHVCR